MKVLSKYYLNFFFHLMCYKELADKDGQSQLHNIYLSTSSSKAASNCSEILSMNVYSNINVEAYN